MSATHLVVGASGAIGGAVADRWSADYGSGRVLRAARAGADLVLDPLDALSLAEAAAQIPDDSLEAVFVATGILHNQHATPEKTLRQLDGAAMAHVFTVNSIAPMLVAQALFAKLRRRGPAMFAVLSARVGSISDNHLGGWYSYRASKAALNMMVKTLAIEGARRRPELVCVGLHPGTVDTPLSKPFQGGVPAEQLFAPAEAATHLSRVMAALTPAQSGRIWAWDGQEILP